MEYAVKDQWAKVVTENKEIKLQEAIEQLILNKNERQKIAQNAIKIAEENHSSLKVQSSFQEALCLLK